ncbi:MAG: PIG-L family deacetylase [Gemmatimonadetes bacterium]|nr:PIG-L family deacetylase [Gemmatimonadota bacterium]
MRTRTILGLFAHPDDESMGPGATLAKYAAAGHRVAVVTATSGGAGRLFRERPADAEGRAELERVRQEETRAAAAILGIEHLGFLGWPDGGLRGLDILEIEEEFAAIIRRERPDVVITFHGSGISYHPDHRVVTLATVGAFQGAGHADWYPDGPLRELAPHAPERLYLYTPFRRSIVPDWPRRVYPADDAEITTVIDTAAFADTKWAAISAHASQQFGPPFRALYDAGLFAEEHFVRFPERPGEAGRGERETELWPVG